MTRDAGNVSVRTVGLVVAMLVMLCGALIPASTTAQGQLSPIPTQRPAVSPGPPAQVEIDPVAADDDIARRIEGILAATGQFVDATAEVREGVVFLDGQARDQDWRIWAESLAGNTEGVVAVVNRLEDTPSPALDFGPAWAEVEALWRDSIEALPLVAVVLLILLVSMLIAYLISRAARYILRDRMPSRVLTNVTVLLIVAPVVIVGIYVALRVAGLTQLALTVLGGTGLAGLIIGIAFRDIAENFLASILLSLRNPFQAGDRIDVAGFVGIVERITTRSTILMTLDGNHLQIPNSTVYKSTITNYTANPMRRMDFAVGIGYDAIITEAQDAIDTVLRAHPAVLDDPEPLVLVEQLSASTVDLRAYFWFNGTEYEGLKLESSLIRLAKRGLEARGISMPDEAREVVFPEGVPLVTTDGIVPAPVATKDGDVRPAMGTSAGPGEPELLSTASEGGLRSEDARLREQARESRVPEEGEDLLGHRR